MINTGFVAFLAVTLAGNADPGLTATWSMLHFPPSMPATEPAQKYSPETMKKREEAERVINTNKEKLRQDPNDAGAHKAMGDAYLFLEEYEASFNAYKEALRIAPNNAEAYRGLGQIETLMRRFDRAAEFYKEAVRLNPRFGRAQADLGKTFVSLFRDSEAIGPLAEGIRLMSQSGAGKEIEHEDYYSLGEAYRNTGQYQDAVTAYQQALKLLPGHVWTQTGLAEAHYGLKQYDQAIASAKRSLQTAPYDNRSNRVIGDSYAAMEQYDRAIEYYNESIRVSPHRNQIQALWGLGRTYNRMGKHEEAVATFAKGIQYATTPKQFAIEADINPAFLAALYFSSAEANLNLGRGEAAVEASRKYIELQTWSDTNAAYAALMSYFGSRKAGRDEDAQKVLTEALAKTDAKAWSLSIIKYLRGDLTEKVLLELAIDNDKMTEARAYVGMNLALMGRVDAARPHLDWVVKNGNREFIEYTLAQAELRRITTPKKVSSGGAAQ